MRNITLLAGGVGGAKLAVGLAAVCAERDLQLTIIGNVADDHEFHGLWVSPDIDTLVYSLAGLSDPHKGWGLTADTDTVLAALAALGSETWMWLGDRDFATHIRRTELRRQGMRPTAVARLLRQALGADVEVLLPTDDTLQTQLRTPEGWLSFQDYFVRRRCEPEVLEVRIEGAERARPTPEALAALREADLLLVAPSNPVVSIGPILAVPGLREAWCEAQVYKLAVSPLIGGRTVKGPADRMLAAAGFDCNSLGVAAIYEGLLDGLVIDSADRADAAALSAAGLDVRVTDTLMQTPADKARLAAEVLAFAGRAEMVPS